MPQFLFLCQNYSWCTTCLVVIPLGLVAVPGELVLVALCHLVLVADERVPVAGHRVPVPDEHQIVPGFFLQLIRAFGTFLSHKISSLYPFDY